MAITRKQILKAYDLVQRNRAERAWYNHTDSLKGVPYSANMVARPTPEKLSFGGIARRCNMSVATLFRLREDFAVLGYNRTRVAEWAKLP